MAFLQQLLTYQGFFDSKLEFVGKPANAQTRSCKQTLIKPLLSLTEVTSIPLLQNLLATVSICQAQSGKKQEPTRAVCVPEQYQEQGLLVCRSGKDTDCQQHEPSKHCGQATTSPTLCCPHARGIHGLPITCSSAAHNFRNVDSHFRQGIAVLCMIEHYTTPSYASHPCIPSQSCSHAAILM